MREGRRRKDEERGEKARRRRGRKTGSASNSFTEVTVSPDKLTNPFTTYNKMTLQKFTTISKNLPWKTFFQVLVRGQLFFIFLP
jgi:hypothetical protein